LIHKSITLTHGGYEIHQRNHQGIDGPLPIHNRPDLWDAARRLGMVRAIGKPDAERSRRWVEVKEIAREK
jgi:hypothetical protein